MLSICLRERVVEDGRARERSRETATRTERFFGKSVVGFEQHKPMALRSLCASEQRDTAIRGTEILPRLSVLAANRVVARARWEGSKHLCECPRVVQCCHALFFSSVHLLPPALWSNALCHRKLSVALVSRGVSESFPRSSSSFTSRLSNPIVPARQYGSTHRDPQQLLVSMALLLVDVPDLRSREFPWLMKSSLV